MTDDAMSTSGPITALRADIDGTLVTKAKVLTQRAIEAVRRLRERGVEFFVTSGRPTPRAHRCSWPVRLCSAIAVGRERVCRV